MHVVITGASRGVGAALKAAYEAEGHKVTGTSRAGGDGLVALDVSDAGSIRAMADALGDAPVDLLVCNAGVYLDKGHALDDGYPAEMWAEQLAVNVTGPFLCVQALLPVQVARRLFRHIAVLHILAAFGCRLRPARGRAPRHVLPLAVTAPIDVGRGRSACQPVPRGLCRDSLSISRRPPVYVYKRAAAGSAAAPSWAAAADGALTGRQRGVSRALTGPQRLTAPARATACCAAAPPRGCCSQRRSDGPLLVEQRRPEGAARAGRPCGRHHAGTSSASTGRVQVVAVERACVVASRARSGATVWSVVAVLFVAQTDRVVTTV